MRAEAKAHQDFEDGEIEDLVDTHDSLFLIVDSPVVVVFSNPISLTLPQVCDLEELGEMKKTRVKSSWNDKITRIIFS